MKFILLSFKERWSHLLYNGCEPSYKSIMASKKIIDLLAGDLRFIYEKW